jgi:hypothetical protein
MPQKDINPTYKVYVTYYACDHEHRDFDIRYEGPRFGDDRTRQEFSLCLECAQAMVAAPWPKAIREIHAAANVLTETLA